MEKPQLDISLDSVLITEALQQRIAHAPNWQAQVEAMQALTQQLTQPPEVLLQRLVEQLIRLCRAGSAGVSLLESTPAGETIFRVGALAGALTQSIDDNIPRSLSPCGVCLDRGTPILLNHPGRYFTYLQAMPMLLVEGLILPLVVAGEAMGTLWICSHDHQHRFDREDLRVMTDLAHLAVAALSLHRRPNQQPEPEILQESQPQLPERTKLLERAEPIDQADQQQTITLRQSEIQQIREQTARPAERWQTAIPQIELEQDTPEVVSDFSGDLASAPEIVLANDNADMCSDIQHLFSNHYRVRVAATGTAAWAAIQQSLPDLVLIDVMRPDLDGFELLHKLRADPQTQNIPVILLSARAGEAAKLAGLETGADDYLIKPFSAPELLTRIEATLKLTPMRREAAQREQQMQMVQHLNEQLEQQVSDRTAQLAAVNQELEAFASAIAHDLRVPLNYTKVFAQRLREQLNPDLLSPSALQILDIIEQSATQSETMVVNLLEFSRLGRTALQETVVDVNASVETVLEQLQVELTGRIVHWQIEPLPVVIGDPILLQMVLQNLLSNAVKYTRQRTEARITIGSFKQAQEVVIFVQDNGTGFDMQYQDRLFMLFQRLHPQEEFAGTGVGLATVRRIVHRHGGRTWAEGVVDQGATFYFSLPQREVST